MPSDVCMEMLLGAVVSAVILAIFAGISGWRLLGKLFGGT